MPDYSKAVIYTIRYKLDDSLLYVGSTTQPLYKRWGDHKSNAYNVNCNRYNMILYQKIRETNDIKNWYIELYENSPCNNKEELHKKEGEIQRKLNACLNRVIAGRTQKEYREEHKEEIAEMKKKWCINNPDRHREQRRQWFINNPDKVKAINERKRLKNMSKITCECGITMRRDYLKRHIDTIKHKEFINKIE
jgi:hypothetical protein